MSMLAGPRRKQKIINLRAKNNDWSQDSNKFGQRMLEKMGWSAGKGLGANENGIVEHVIARYKNDDKGLGFEDKNDQWTKHEDDFNALLANLSKDDSQEALVPASGISLETKSKKSKARVHYHKFIRGKDMSRYSEKDLANIFGKKSLKKEENFDSFTQQDSNTVTTDQVFTTTDQVFTEKGSMEDYFKNKLLALKSKNKKVASIENHYNGNNEVDHGFKGFSGTSDKDLEACEENKLRSLSSYYVANEANVEDIEMMDTCNSKGKKRKKDKKQKKKNHEQEILEMCENEKDNLLNTYDSNELMNNDHGFKGFSGTCDKDLESCEENKLSSYEANQQNEQEIEMMDTCNIKTKKHKKFKKEKKKNNKQEIFEMCEESNLPDTFHSDELMINELLPDEGKKSKKVRCAQENTVLDQIKKKAKKKKMSFGVEYISLDVSGTPKKKRKSNKLNS